MPPKFERCVSDVKAKGGAKNPYAICRAQLGTDKQIRAGTKPSRPGKGKK